MECVELAPAVGCVARFDSGSRLHALHTLRAASGSGYAGLGTDAPYPPLLLRHYRKRHFEPGHDPSVSGCQSPVPQIQNQKLEIQKFTGGLVRPMVRAMVRPRSSMFVGLG